MPHIRFHDLRHTYAALNIAASVDLYTLSRRMGHNSITVTADKYGHLYQGHTPGRRLARPPAQAGMICNNSILNYILPPETPNAAPHQLAVCRILLWYGRRDSNPQPTV